MLLGSTLPASWRDLLTEFRSVFRRSSTFTLFMVLATGLVAQTRRRTVVRMLAGAGMATVVSFHAACRFFATHVWSADRLGLVLARVIVTRLLDDDAPIVVAVDDTVFRRWGRQVHRVFWCHDAAAQGPNTFARGNRWIIAGIVLTVPFTTHPVCLPVLFRLWAGKGTATPVQLAGQLLELLAGEFTGRTIHAVGDAAYHGTPLLVPGTSITTRLPANAALFAPAPPRVPGQRGRPRLKGARLGRPADLAETATWHQLAVSRYGRTVTLSVADVDSLWYGTFKNTAGRTILVRDPGQTSAHAIAIYTTDQHTPTAEIVARYAARWPIETAIAAGKQLLGIGQARNRVPRAVARTVPFSFIVYSLIIVWYTTSGHTPDDLANRHAAEPWYPHKDEPAFEDMLIKLRVTIIAARISAVTTTQPKPDKYHAHQLACAAAGL